jgi:predicted RNase H-like HicB family nuclease
MPSLRHDFYLHGDDPAKRRWWIGWIEEVPGVNAQERTKETLLASLKEVLKEALEFNREDARASAQGGCTEEFVTV